MTAALSTGRKSYRDTREKSEASRGAQTLTPVASGAVRERCESFRTGPSVQKAGHWLQSGLGVLQASPTSCPLS